MGRIWQEQKLELLPDLPDLEACCKPQTENRELQPNTASYSPPDSVYNELARKQMTASCPVMGGKRVSRVYKSEVVMNKVVGGEINNRSCCSPSDATSSKVAN